MHPSIRRYCYFLSVLIFVSIQYAYAQKKEAHIDSLKSQLSIATTVDKKLSLLNLLGCELNCDKQAEKFKYIQEARTLSKKEHDNKSLMIAEYHLAGYYKDCIKEIPLAIEWYENALSLAKENKNNQYTHQCYLRIADCYEILGDNSNVLIYYKKILELDLDVGNRIQTFGNSGRIYAEMGDYPQALENYNKAYKLLNQDINITEQPTIYDTLTLMGLKYQMANIYMITSDYDRALSSYKEIQSLEKHASRKAFDVLIKLGIGDCYLKKNEERLAIEYYNEVNSIVTKENFIDNTTKRDFQTQALIKLSNAYYSLDLPDSSLIYARQTLAIAEGDKDNQPLHKVLPLVYTTIGKAYSAQNKNSLALQYIKKAIASSQKTNAIEYQSNALYALSNLYKNMGLHKAALDAYEEHIQLRDSIYSQTKLEELTRIDMQGDFDRQRFRDSVRVEEEKAVAKHELQKQRLLTYSGFIGVLLLLFISFIVYRSLRHVKKANRIISRAKDTITQEKQESDRLLKNILPEEVADELKTKGNVVAKQYDPVTVLFTDFVDFTLVGERLSPQDLVEELDACFKAFDEIIDKYDIEKIKTVGDAYLAVSGLPLSNPNHGVDIVNAAIEICAFVKERRAQLGDRTFNIRVGINSGSVVAGIVGMKKFAYDIWGDTVNIAARMEQHSLPGKINISENTYQLVKGKFNCSYRGEIAAKNKGHLKMYFIDT